MPRPLRPRLLPGSAAASAAALAAAFLLGVAGCTTDGTAPTLTASVSLSVTATVEGPKGSALPLRSPAHELVIQRASLVLDGVELAGAAGDASLEHRPFVIDLPLDGSVHSLVAGTVSPGRYAAIRLRLRPPTSGDPGDVALLVDHPDVEGLSVRVEGRWNGEPFVFGRALDAIRRLDLLPPIEVEGRTANVTLALDVASWFRAADGSLVDPRLAESDTAVGRAVEERIRASFAAFEDADADGVAGPG